MDLAQEIVLCFLMSHLTVQSRVDSVQPGIQLTICLERRQQQQPPQQQQRRLQRRLQHRRRRQQGRQRQQEQRRVPAEAPTIVFQICILF